MMQVLAAMRNHDDLAGLAGKHAGNSEQEKSSPPHFRRRSAKQIP
jgi:hypothetical protein